jgi:hypothetical protein
LFFITITALVVSIWENMMLSKYDDGLHAKMDTSCNGIHNDGIHATYDDGTPNIPII